LLGTKKGTPTSGENSGGHNKNEQKNEGGILIRILWFIDTEKAREDQLGKKPRGGKQTGENIEVNLKI